MKTKYEYLDSIQGYGQNCYCCKQKNHAYMVKFDLWKRIVPEEHRKDFLCIKCFEEKLGRHLTRTDFIIKHDFTGADLPINHGWFGFDIRVYCELPSIKTIKGA